MEAQLQVPAGLEGCNPHGAKLQIYQEGGRSEWMQYSAVKMFTNAFVINTAKQQMLLGYKKRGFATGVYNGFGGKVDIGETSLEAAHRELKEEAGIEASLEHCGVLFFYQEGHQYAHFIDIYRADSWTGEPTETDEMKPQWFQIPSLSGSLVNLAEDLAKTEQGGSETSHTTIPLHRMWKDDVLWYPLLLSKRRFIGRVDLVEAPSTPEPLDPSAPLHPLVKWWFATID
ncbi:hypothetical protein M408DRAFT_326650 [Serendipita vermifera MAFF 305830]|uniref:Oxidized purine nucleoside triphosphate hydrolase n=1 Tax=Serendipita vermifera MAFF 305830 TaxID=933852 RepID=A0A0C2XVQ9_SERVB|nr:hypothetical protein M408DRAFT_326650 [Serendipita vermifera MAFF 305830]